MDQVSYVNHISDVRRPELLQYLFPYLFFLLCSTPVRATSPFLASKLFLRDPFVHTKRSLPIGFVPCRRSWQEIPKHGLEFLPESPSCAKTRLLASHELDNDPKGRATFVSRNTIVVHTSSGSHHPSTRTHHVCAFVISSVILARHLVTMSTGTSRCRHGGADFQRDRHVSCVVVQNIYGPEQEPTKAPKGQTSLLLASVCGADRFFARETFALFMVWVTKLRKRQACHDTQQ